MPVSWSLGWAKGFVGGAPLQRSNFVFFKSCLNITSLNGCPGGKRGARGADRDGVWDLQEARLRVHARVQADRKRAPGRVGPWTILNPHSQIPLRGWLGGNGAGLSWSRVFASQKTESKILVRLYMLEILPLMNWQWKYCEESHIPSRSIGLCTLPFISSLFECR